MNIDTDNRMNWIRTILYEKYGAKMQGVFIFNNTFFNILIQMYKYLCYEKSCYDIYLNFGLIMAIFACLQLNRPVNLKVIK